MAAMVAADAGFPGVGNRELLIRVQQMRPRGSVAVLALNIHHVRSEFGTPLLTVCGASTKLIIKFTVWITRQAKPFLKLKLTL